MKKPARSRVPRFEATEVENAESGIDACRNGLRFNLGEESESLVDRHGSEGNATD